MLTAALIGNPNVGKTSLFNVLTGSDQYVGNWAGVTVDKKEGFLNGMKIVDLPGIYAFDTFSNEEKVSKEFLMNGNVDIILNIVDATSLHRNLYLTLQLLKFNKPIVLIINMIDAAEKNGLTIDYEYLENCLKVKVVPISASKGIGIDNLKNLLNSGNFLAHSCDNDYHFQTEKETFDYIDNVLSSALTNKTNRKNDYTEKLDKILLNKFLSYPLFFAFIYFIFKITFSWVGQPLALLLDKLIKDYFSVFVSNLLSSFSPWFKSLIIDGIIGGVGSVLVFFPVIVTLFFCISFLEDSGYMARAALIMDKLMRKIGLSGKAFIPMILGFGCSVPAIMTSKTLESEKDRKLTALLVPLMSCNAKLPVYTLFAAALFPKSSIKIIGFLYLFGIGTAFLLGLLFKNTVFKSEEEPFIIELPTYKMPEMKNLLSHTYDKGKSFLKKIGTIIFSVSVLVWFLSNFNIHGASSIESSFLYYFGNFISPIFKPLGFASWQNSVALTAGIMSKEIIIGTLGVIYKGNLTGNLGLYFTKASAISFLVFVLLYTPCISVIATMHKEFGKKMAIFSVAYQMTLAYVGAFIVYRIALSNVNIFEMLTALFLILISLWIIIKNIKKKILNKGKCSSCSGCGGCSNCNQSSSCKQCKL